jgi:hypothetical protein
MREPNKTEDKIAQNYNFAEALEAHKKKKTKHARAHAHTHTHTHKTLIQTLTILQKLQNAKLA